ncbi:MAG: hypothetical protein KKD48_00250 [Nanoarchaeota archaeon]|nr:hypothetical protein [Nanoarchaeota archaeon]
MKTLKNIIYGLALTGLSVFSTNCGNIPNQDVKNYINFVYPGVKILSEPVTGEVGEKYESEIYTNRDADCSILNSPSWLKINNNILQGTPIHISNDEVGKQKVEVKCSNWIFKDTKEFGLDVEPGVYNNRLYDHIQPISLYGDSIEDIILLCETDFCPDVFRDNNGYLEKRAEGIKNSINELYNVTGIDFLYLPVEIHLAEDTTCIPNSFIANTISPNIICDHLYNRINRGVEDLGHTNCLDPRYDEACINENTYFSPDSIEANGTEIHEGTHLLLLGQMQGKIQENFTYALQYVLSDNNGFKEFNSFCDLHNNTIGMNNWANIFLDDLCTDFGLDIDNISVLFSKLRTEYENGNYALNKPIPIKKLKCIVDSSIQDNSYNYFVSDICNNPYYGPNPACNNNPASNNYVNPNYCGD